MALRLVPEHNNVIALRYAENASSVHNIKVSGLKCVLHAGLYSNASAFALASANAAFAFALAFECPEVGAFAFALAFES